MHIRQVAPTTLTLLLAVAGLTGCGTAETGGSDAGTAPATQATTSPTIPATQGSTGTTPKPAGKLTFTGTTLDGKPFDAAVLAGKPALIWFWAPWCPTCVAEAPDVLDVQRTHGAKVGILGVAGLDKKSAMQPFVDRTKTGGLTHLADPDGEIWRHFGVTQQSTYVLLDADGNVSLSGVLSGDELRAKVAALAG